MAWKAIPTIRVSVTGCMVVSPNTEIGSPPIIFPKDMISAEKGIITVSYTHLDVYKRQV